MLSPFRAVAPFDNRAEAIAHIGQASGRPMSAKQKALAPLAPIFAACSSRGLVVNEANRTQRLYAVNKYLNGLDGFDWLSESFKELLDDTAAILVIADAIAFGKIRW